MTWRRSALLPSTPLFVVLLALAATGPTTHAADPPAGPTVTVAAAGDIACAADEPATPRSCQQAATAALIEAHRPDAVLAVGDLQYPKGSLEDFLTSYDRTWGAFKSITWPVPGNHEYYGGGSGYFGYWGPRAGDPEKGYYSFDLGAWHILALNSECEAIGGCGADGPQIRWLRSDLAANPTRCALAYFHKPRFSSGPHGSNRAYEPLWRALQGGGVDVVLGGHDHDYERFALQDAQGLPDPDHGMRQFVVGTGGAPQYVVLWKRSNIEVLRARAFGALFLTLAPDSYSWTFRSIQGEAFSDSGATACH